MSCGDAENATDMMIRDHDNDDADNNHDDDGDDDHVLFYGSVDEDGSHIEDHDQDDDNHDDQI